MFRSGALNSLYQGDILVVPETTLRDRDPRVATREARDRSCKVCGNRFEEQRTCSRCQAQLPKPEKNYLRIASLGSRLKAKEDVLQGTPEFLASLKSAVVMLESHACDIDRQGDICCWLLRPLDALSRDQQQSVRAGENGSLMLVEGAGPLPPCAVDFNAALTVPSWFLGERTTYTSNLKGGQEAALIPFAETVAQRAASLDAFGLKRLYEAKIRHLTRTEFDLDLPVLDPDDPDRPSPNPFPERGWVLPIPKWAGAAP